MNSHAMTTSTAKTSTTGRQLNAAYSRKALALAGAALMAGALLAASPAEAIIRFEFDPALWEGEFEGTLSVEVAGGAPTMASLAYGVTVEAFDPETRRA